MSDAFDKAYADWLQSHDPATEQFRPDAETWAASHTEPVINTVNRVGLMSWLAYGFFFVVLPVVGAVYGWAEATWKEWRK